MACTSERGFVVQGDARAKFLHKPLAWQIKRDGESPVGAMARFKYHGELSSHWSGAETQPGIFAPDVQVLRKIPQGHPELVQPKSFIQAKFMLVLDKLVKYAPCRADAQWLRSYCRTETAGFDIQSDWDNGEVGQRATLTIGDKSTAVRVIRDVPNDFWRFGVNIEPLQPAGDAAAVAQLRQEYKMVAVLNRASDAQLAARERARSRRAGKRKNKRGLEVEHSVSASNDSDRALACLSGDELTAFTEATFSNGVMFLCDPRRFPAPKGSDEPGKGGHGLFVAELCESADTDANLNTWWYGPVNKQRRVTPFVQRWAPGWRDVEGDNRVDYFDVPPNASWQPETVQLTTADILVSEQGRPIAGFSLSDTGTLPQWVVVPGLAVSMEVSELDVELQFGEDLDSETDYESSDSSSLSESSDPPSSSDESSDVEAEFSHNNPGPSKSDRDAGGKFSASGVKHAPSPSTRSRGKRRLHSTQTRAVGRSHVNKPGNPKGRARRRSKRRRP